jgi:hypothetical protein
MSDLDIDVVIIGLRTELDLFDLDLDLVLSGRSCPLLAVVLQLTIVLNSTNGRATVWRHFNEVQPSRLSEADGILHHELTELVALLINDKDAWHTDSAVDAWLVLVGLRLNTTAW